MHQTYSTLIKRDTDWLDFSILNRTNSFMPFIQRIDYILLDLSIDDKALWKVQNEFDLYAIFERWGAEVFDEALEKIEDLGFELALHIFWHHNIFRPILYADAGYTPF